MMAEQKLAEASTIGDYIREEMKARQWSIHDVAERMGGVVAVSKCTVDLLLNLTDARVTLSEETADFLEAAFGIDAQTWLNIDEMWRQWEKNRIVDEYYNMGGR